MWNAIQYVGSGLSLVAFIVAAVVFAYRGRLKRQAEIIKSAPADERLKAIQATLEYNQIDTSNLTREQKEKLALKQIGIKDRRELLIAGVSLVIAALLALIAIIQILNNKPIEQPVQKADPPAAIYRVCLGPCPYREAVILPCEASVQEWAKKTCSKFTQQIVEYSTGGFSCNNKVVDVKCTEF